MERRRHPAVDGYFRNTGSDLQEDIYVFRVNWEAILFPAGLATDVERLAGCSAL